MKRISFNCAIFVNHCTVMALSLVVLTLTGLSLFIAITSVNAQELSPFSEFQAMSLEELNTLQVKLTYVGKQEEVVPTVAFTSLYNTLNISKFVPYRRSGIYYENDDIAVNTCNATPEELQAMIQNISSLPAVTGGGVSSEPYLSFSMFNSVSSGDKAFEAVLNQSETKDVFGKIHFALQANQGCLNVLRAQWRELGLGIGSLDPDSDGDGLSDADESIFGTDSSNGDTDGDGFADGAEIVSGRDPLNPLG